MVGLNRDHYLTEDRESQDSVEKALDTRCLGPGFKKMMVLINKYLVLIHETVFSFQSKCSYGNQTLGNITCGGPALRSNLTGLGPPGEDIWDWGEAT